MLERTFFEESAFYPLSIKFIKIGNIMDTEAETTVVNTICIFVGQVCWAALIAVPFQMAPKI